VRRFLDRGRGPAAAVVVLALLVLPAGARAAAGTFYARGGGGNAGATCALGDECALPKAVTQANAAGDGSQIVLMPGPDFTPNAELTVEGQIAIAPQPGQRARILGADGVEVALRLKKGAEIHDVDIVAGTGSAALRLWSASGDRVTATASSPGADACEFEESAFLADSVCHAVDGAGIESSGFVEEVANVDAIGGRNGILVEAVEFAGGDEFDAFDSIAIGGAGFADVAVETPDTKRTAEVFMFNSAYDSVDGGAHPGKATITAPGTEGGVTAPPQFVDAAAGDFHQLLASPTVDTGRAYEELADLDLDRNPRSLTAHRVCGGPTAGPTDIGAYEYVPPVPDCGAPPQPPAAPAPPSQPLVLEAYMKHQKIDSAKGTATFTFGGAGSFAGFQCELVRPAPKPAKPAAKAAKAKRKAPTFVACGSPKTYKHLVPGAYTFKVRAVTADGVDGVPVSRKFTIHAPRPKEQR
jgi:hypothetical protein